MFERHIGFNLAAVYYKILKRDGKIRFLFGELPEAGKFVQQLLRMKNDATGT